MRAAIVSLGLLAAISPARADEEAIKVKDLPKVVLDAVKARFPGAEVTGAAREEEDNKLTYEVVLKDQGAPVDVAVSPKGKILEVERTIPTGTLPAAVAAAIQARYPRAEIKKAEQVIKYEEGEGEEQFFEVVLSVPGRDSVEVKLSPKGKILDEEEGKGEDDEKEKGEARKKDKG